MKKLTLYILPLACLFLAACGGKTKSTEDNGNIFKYSENIKVEDRDGYSIASVRNPWDTAKLLAKYYLVPDSLPLPKGVNLKDGKVVRTPVKSAVVYSNVHVSLIDELGSLSAIKGICDSEYITDSAAIAGIRNKIITDCGNSSSPNLERIMALKPDIILLSPYENSNGHGKLENLGVSIIEGADYTESSPLARAEWMRFYGRLFGRGATADSLFASAEKDYNDIKGRMGNIKSRPAVIFDGVYGQVWNVPTSRSVTGHIIQDAGGINPFSDYSKAGSEALSPEQVVYKAGDADYWFVRYFSPTDIKSSDWVSQDKVYKNFKAVKTGNLYGSNTTYSGVFDDAAFHPHLILADIASILHPELDIKPIKEYYHRLP